MNNRRIVVRFPVGIKVFSLPQLPKKALGTTKIAIQVPGSLVLMIKWQRCETNHSPSSISEVKVVTICP
jgi:hypothetical protein